MFFDKMAGAIKKGIDTNQYSAKDLPTMQKAYDEIMAQMPALKKIAADSRRLAVQHGGAGRQDVGEKDTQTITVTKKNPLAKGDLVDFVSRYFTPQATILEDPVTGSAHCTLTPFWSSKLRKKELNALQISNRGGELICKDILDRVIIGGEARVFSIGSFSLK